MTLAGDNDRLQPWEMPSALHEALLLLFRNRPTLAPELLRGALNVTLPPYTEAAIASSDLGEIQPAEYRADLVVELLDGEKVTGIVVEIQLTPDPDKHFTWPAYVVNLRARHKIPVCLLVVTIDENTARWAAQPVHLGGSNEFRPIVLGPSVIPEIRDATQAHADPELAVLSAMAHGRDPDVVKAARIAAAARDATLGLDEERARLYFDLVQASLSDIVRQELQAMDPAKYEYQSELVRGYVAQGRQQGKLEGRADLITRQLTLRFGVLPAHAVAQIANATIEQLDGIGERLLTASTLEQALAIQQS